jgi:hypothetical protein
METADVVLMKSDPFDVIGAIALSRATVRKMRQNLVWAAGYNTIAFPIAAGLLYPPSACCCAPRSQRSRWPGARSWWRLMPYCSNGRVCPAFGKWSRS